MKKIFFVVGITLFFNHICASQIQWNPDSLITWNNFKGTPKSDGNSKALTMSRISCSLGFNSNCFTYKVYAYFYEGESWALDSASILLKHERNHFDITEIFARKIRKYLIESFRLKRSRAEIGSNITQLMSELRKYQVLYDNETNHSINFDQQILWSNKINFQLQELAEFKTANYDSCNDKNKSD